MEANFEGVWGCVTVVTTLEGDDSCGAATAGPKDIDLFFAGVRRRAAAVDAILEGVPRIGDPIILGS